MTAETKRRKQQRPQLRVVFDTNVLHTGTASDLVRQEVASLIRESVFPDLEIQWHLPDLVRHERQYQMQIRALSLLPGIAKVEKLLGHNLAITEQMLIESVEKAASQRHAELGLLSVALNHNNIDWHRIILDAAYRRPPFQAGETEKGFRDCMIMESFLQLVADSPKTPKTCRIVLISGDKLLSQAVEARIAGSTNARVVASLEELKGLINTLVSQVDESFLAILKPKAEKLFFVPKEESTLFYKEHIRQKLHEKFAAELAAPPPGATDRSNGTWRISPPNFVKKTRQRIQWTSRISIETEASKRISQWPGIKLSSLQGAPTISTPPDDFSNLLLQGSPFYGEFARVKPLSFLAKPEASAKWADYVPVESGGSVTTHKGIDAYDVFWSADVTTSHELRRSLIDEIRHLEPTWESVG